MSLVTVVCKLPHGIIIEHPMDRNKRFALAGANKAKIVGANYGTTQMPKDIMDQWLAVNVDFAPVRSGAIFIERDLAGAEQRANDEAERKTGFEPLKPEAHGVKAAEA